MSSSDAQPDAQPDAEPDDKDWTWVLERRCPECGYDAAQLPAPGPALGDALARLVRGTTAAWSVALAAGDVTVRPAPRTWSPLEYACHVRDVHRVFDERLALMLAGGAGDAPTFANWDQDETARTGAYGSQDPVEVEVALIEAAGQVAGRYAAVPDDAWGRRGVRSNGSEFTVATLGAYHLHDVVHHLHDVGSPARPGTD